MVVKINKCKIISTRDPYFLNHYFYFRFTLKKIHFYEKIHSFVYSFISFFSFAQISRPDIYGDHMVLQQKTSIKIRGWGTPLEKVKLQTSWDQKIYETETNNLANWQIDIQTPAAGGPFQIKLKGYNEVLLDDILIGEVWLASGQSNMEWSANFGIDEAAKTHRRGQE